MENKTETPINNLSNNTISPKRIMRTGVYGITFEGKKMLLIRQQHGPYAGKLDFPGGGIEFGESVEEALRREYAEEVAMEFDSLEPIDNLTATIDVPKTSSKEAYSFYQIGLIYRIDGCRLINGESQGELRPIWIDIMALTENECSKLLWKYRRKC